MPSEPWWREKTIRKKAKRKKTLRSSPRVRFLLQSVSSPHRLSERIRGFAWYDPVPQIRIDSWHKRFYSRPLTGLTHKALRQFKSLNLQGPRAGYSICACVGWGQMSRMSSTFPGHIPMSIVLCTLYAIHGWFGMGVWTTPFDLLLKTSQSGVRRRVFAFFLAFL